MNEDHDVRHLLDTTPNRPVLLEFNDIAERILMGSNETSPAAAFRLCNGGEMVLDMMDLGDVVDHHSEALRDGGLSPFTTARLTAEREIAYSGALRLNERAGVPLDSRLRVMEGLPRTTRPSTHDARFRTFLNKLTANRSN